MNSFISLDRYLEKLEENLFTSLENIHCDEARFQIRLSQIRMNTSPNFAHPPPVSLFKIHNRLYYENKIFNRLWITQGSLSKSKWGIFGFVGLPRGVRTKIWKSVLNSPSKRMLFKLKKMGGYLEKRRPWYILRKKFHDKLAFRNLGNSPKLEQNFKIYFLQFSSKWATDCFDTSLGQFG